MREREKQKNSNHMARNHTWISSWNHVILFFLRMKFHSAKEDRAGSLFTLLDPVLLHCPVYCPPNRCRNHRPNHRFRNRFHRPFRPGRSSRCFCSCTRMARIHQLQRFVGNKADIDTADAAHRTIFHSLRTVTSQRDVERTQSVNLHLIALGERQAQLFHKCLNGVISHLRASVTIYFRWR